MANVTGQPLLLTVQQASERVNLDRSTFYAILMRGECQSIKIGRSRRVPVSALEQYVDRLIAEQNSDRLPSR